MSHLNKTVSSFPDQKESYLWRAVTCSHLPQLFGVREIVLADLDTLICSRNRKWDINTSDSSFILNSYLNLSKEYSDRTILNEAIKQVVQCRGNQSNIAQGLHKAISNLDSLQTKQ
jgi:hypothetical protein